MEDYPLLQKTEPLFLDLATDEKELHRLFDEEHIENIVEYIKALQEIGAAASFDDKYSHAVGVLKLIRWNVSAWKYAEYLQGAA